MSSWKTWPRSFFVNVKQRPWFYLALGCLLILAIWTHFYLLRTHLHFDLDEATHAQTIDSFVFSHNLLGKGPGTSSGHLYHGAYYYYLYVLPALLTNGAPLAFGVWTILFSLASVYLLAITLRDLYGEKTALIATLLYVGSCTAVIYARWLWNPNTIPFFTVLSLYALTRFGQGRRQFLILFGFSLGSITQLHVGGWVFIPVFLFMLPWLLKQEKNGRLWLWTAIAFLLPWTPTIGFEIKTHGELVHALWQLIRQGGGTGKTWRDHFLNGYNYLSFMHRTVIRLPHGFFRASAAIAIGVWVLTLIKKTTTSAQRLVATYLLLTGFFSWLVYAYYNDILYVHVSEHLFVIYPIITGLLLGAMLGENLFHPDRPWLSWAGGWVAVSAQVLLTLLVGIILVIMLHQNFRLYQADIINGDREYGTEVALCQMIQARGDQDIEIIFNGKVNPVFITYVCGRQFHLQFGNRVLYTVTTDWRQQFDVNRVVL